MNEMLREVDARNGVTSGPDGAEVKDLFRAIDSFFPLPEVLRRTLNGSYHASVDSNSHEGEPVIDGQEISITGAREFDSDAWANFLWLFQGLWLPPGIGRVPPFEVPKPPTDTPPTEAPGKTPCEIASEEVELLEEQAAELEDDIKDLKRERRSAHGDPTEVKQLTDYIEVLEINLRSIRLSLKAAQADEERYCGSDRWKSKEVAPPPVAPWRKE